EGVPVGGTTGQALTKASNTDYDTEWSTINSAAWGNITGTLSDQTDLQTALDSKLEAVVDDTSPQLGGNLDLNGFDVGDADAADLTKLSEIAASSTELNILDGVTATTAELNYLDGVTSPIQTQLDAKTTSSDTAYADSWDGVTTVAPSKNAVYDALNTNGVGFVNHGATASTARPEGFAMVIWYGSVEPSNMVAGDIWNQS